MIHCFSVVRPLNPVTVQFCPRSGVTAENEFACIPNNRSFVVCFRNFIKTFFCMIRIRFFVFSTVHVLKAYKETYLPLVFVNFILVVTY